MLENDFKGVVFPFLEGESLLVPNFLVSSNPLLINYYAKMIIDTDLKGKIEKLQNPYGDGKTSEKIVEILLKLIK